MTTIEVYHTSNGDLTRSYYKELSSVGPIGIVAMNLFRAQKCSVRAKKYTKRSWTADAYQRKQYSIDELCKVLLEHGPALSITFGWKPDLAVVFGGFDGPTKHSWVFYVDLPCGQVSFHTPERGEGPDYPGDWDGIKGASEVRVIEFCDKIFNSKSNGTKN